MIKKTLEENEEMVQSQNNFSPVIFRKDSFELELPDVDPFLKKHSSSYRPERTNPGITQDQPKRNTNNRRNNSIVQQPIVQQQWPQIKYLGFVRNHSKESALCLLKVNGSMKKVSQGDETTGIFVSGVYRDSIQLVYSGEQRTFKKG